MSNGNSGSSERLLQIYVALLILFAFLCILCLICTWHKWSRPGQIFLRDLSGVKYVRTRVFASGVEVESEGEGDVDGDSSSGSGGGGGTVGASSNFFAPLDAAAV